MPTRNTQWLSGPHDDQAFPLSGLQKPKPCDSISVGLRIKHFDYFFQPLHWSIIYILQNSPIAKCTYQLFSSKFAELYNDPSPVLEQCLHSNQFPCAHLQSYPMPMQPQETDRLCASVDLFFSRYSKWTDFIQYPLSCGELILKSLIFL